MSLESPLSRRWYDINPYTTQAFNLLEKIPEENTRILGRVLQEISVRTLDDYKKERGGFASLGSDRVMGLVQARQKRRQQDQDVNLFFGLRSLFILPDVKRGFFVSRAGLSIYCLLEYKALCKRHDRLENPNEVHILFDHFIEKGLIRGVRVFHDWGILDSQCQKTFERLATIYQETEWEFLSEKEGLSTPTVAAPTPKLVSNKGDMRIRPNTEPDLLEE